MGFNVIYSDLDVMWLRDPLPYMLAFPDADFLISLDTVGTDGSKNPVDSQKVGTPACMCILHVHTACAYCMCIPAAAR
jgi:hypothetical protein